MLQRSRCNSRLGKLKLTWQVFGILVLTSYLLQNSILQILQILIAIVIYLFIVEPLETYRRRYLSAHCWNLSFFSSFLSITFLRTLYTSFSGRNSWNSADCPENWRPWIPHIFVVCLMVWRANKLTGLCLYNPESWYPRFRVWWGSIQPYLYNCFTRSLHSPFESRNMTCERKLNLVFTHFNTNITWIPVLFKL